MEWAATIPLWTLCLMIFALRVCDVTLGTIRTVAIVKGFVSTAVILGFFELLVWVLAISQVISRLDESWFLAISYAGGFATGNAVGIMVERKLAMGTSVVRFMTANHGEAVANALRSDGHEVTTFHGEGSRGPVTLVYAVAPRKQLRSMIRTAQRHDPDIFWISEPAHESSGEPSVRLRPVPHPTGWRAVFKKK
jgi:uncharacterized protein YebE (UPF0316 family)